jgi:hypothetical protein
VIGLVHEEGSIAITSHENVEMVSVDSHVYRELTNMAKEINTRNRAAIDDLNANFDALMRCLMQRG